MPHVIVKLWPGKSEEQKRQLAEDIVKSVMRIFKYGEESVSVSMEEIAPDDWKDRVYQPDILHRPELLYKKPGYKM
ncbi:MAG: tautomerase family protein [Rhodospirillales bacterium]